MEYISCNLCGSTRSKLLFQLKDNFLGISDVKYNVVKCRDCKLVYLNPRPTAEEIHSFYTEDYYRAFLTGEELLKERESQLLAKFEKIKHLPPGHLLDIGCQKGEFPFFMKQRGWEVKGVEFSTTPPNLFGIDISYGTLEEAEFSPETFDLVTLWAVLEHVYHPRELLEEIHRILKPGGKVVLLVPNINSIPGRFMRHDDVPRHTTMFSKRTITKMLNITGFKVDHFHFSNDIFSGSTRGVLNYIIKLLSGEQIDDIVAQNRSRNRWHEFSCMLRGKESKLIKLIDRADAAITPFIDDFMDRLQLGFIMTVEATRL